MNGNKMHFIYWIVPIFVKIDLLRYADVVAFFLENSKVNIERSIWPRMSISLGDYVKETHIHE